MTAGYELSVEVVPLLNIYIYYIFNIRYYMIDLKPYIFVYIYIYMYIRIYIYISPTVCWLNPVKSQ
jgi:hypothetical protein